MAKEPIPTPSKLDPSDVQITRGGGPSWEAAGWSALDTAQRLFVRSADKIHDRMKPFDGLDPAKPAKDKLGWGFAAIKIDQAVQAGMEGHVGDAAFHGFVGASIVATSVAPITDSFVDVITKAPGTRHVADGVAKVLASPALNPTIRAACGALKPVPLAGAAINGAMGIWAAGAQASQGNYKAAGGELAVTVASVGVYAAAVVAGAGCEQL